MEVVNANLPTPGGFLHVMWSDSDVTRGTAAEIEANPAVRDLKLPTLTLNAVPHLRWSNTELRIKAGQPVKLILNNMDPSSFHGFRCAARTAIFSCLWSRALSGSPP